LSPHWPPAFLLAPAFAQGGPPLITDDPDTPGPGHWEINIAVLMEKIHSERRVEVPRVNLNYGVGRRIPLKFEMPWVALQNGAQSSSSTYRTSSSSNGKSGVVPRIETGRGRLDNRAA
jgi:hypothetical protein